MENTEMRTRMSELAAPPGGWPSLTSELVEVRFYLQQGLFDDAYELLSIMQKRHPGHPQLSELARQPKPSRRVDTGVLALVDSVLADSANLVARMPRRAATRFSAPAPGGAERTDVHSVVDPHDEEQTTARPPKAPKTGPQSPTRRSGPQPRAAAAPTPAPSRGTGSQRATSKPTSGPQRTTTVAARASTGSQRTSASRPAEQPAAPARREPTRIYRTVEAPAGARQIMPPPVQASRAARTPPATDDTVIARAPQSGHTVIVEALHAPAPFPAGEDGSRGGKAARKRAAAPKPAPTPPPEPAPERAAEGDKPEPRRRTRFGEHVLNRLR